MPYKIAICDDEPLHIEKIRRILQDEETDDYTSPALLWQAIANGKRYDVLFLDIMMPVMDGLEATRRIRGLNRPDARTVPIFAMTANAFTEDRRRAYDSGMNEHLTKPLEPDTLLRTLAKYLQR